MQGNAGTLNSGGAELNVHTCYSALGAVTDVKEVVKKASECGYAAIAITDTHSVQGFVEAMEAGKKYGVQIICGLDGYYINDCDSGENEKSYHITILARNQTGIRNLYKLLSLANASQDNASPLISKSMLLQHRDGLLFGSAGELGEVFAYIDAQDDDGARKRAELYDYLEIWPTSHSQQQNIKIARLASEIHKPCIASGYVHYLQPEDSLAFLALTDNHEDMKRFKNVPLCFQTQREMLDVFSYLGSECCACVVENPTKVVSQCEDFDLLGDQDSLPMIFEVNMELKRLCTDRLADLYWDHPPVIAKERLERELSVLLSRSDAFLYLAAHHLACRAKTQGLMISGRSFVNASFVAYLLGITEYNPLPPHYFCERCYHVSFSDQVSCGLDLPNASCPYCGCAMHRMGYGIPLELCFGFNGEKRPVIDLYVSETGRKSIESHLQELFGKEHVCRAGTISTISKTMANRLLEEYLSRTALTCTQQEKQHTIQLLMNVKRCDGVHPCVYHIAPPEESIVDYSPILPIRQGELPVAMRFGSSELSLYRMDIVDQDGLTMLQILRNTTGIQPEDIPLDDENTLRYIADGDVSDIPDLQNLRIPEMKKIIEPKRFSDLIVIDGLAHRTGTLEIGDPLIEDCRHLKIGYIAHREDIFQYLTNKGMPIQVVYEIMLAVSKGSAQKILAEKQVLLDEYDIPAAICEALSQIRYLHSKAYSVARMTTAFRLAWYKTYHRAAYNLAYVIVEQDQEEECI